MYEYEKPLESQEVEESSEEVKVRERFDITKRDKIFLVLIIISSIALSIFGICKGFNFGYTISINALMASVGFYFAKGAKKPTAFCISSILLSLTTSLVFSITSNLSVRFFSVIALFVLTLSFLTLLLHGRFADGDLGIIRTIFALLFKQSVPKLPKTVYSVFASSPDKKNNFGRILIGVLCSVPVLLIVLPLLVSSDEAFSGLISKFSDNVFSIIMKCILGFIIALLVINYCFALKKQDLRTFEPITIKGIDNVITTSFLSVLAVCYLAYMFSQLAYFFSAFSGFLPENYEFTMAEYARRGFFELCVIAGINFAIIFLTILLSRKENNKMSLTLRLICTFISVFTLLITATAIAKMVMYIGEFGMTELRISTSAFMIFLFIVFIALILRIYFTKVKVIKTAFITAGVILSLLGIFNINSIIAEYNYRGYKEGFINRTIDVEEIANLGDEGIPYLVMLTEDENASVAEKAEEELLYILKWEEYYELNSKLVGNSPRYTLGDKKVTNPAEMTLAKKNAYAALDQYIEENPNIAQKAGKLYRY